jgi:hypothetical protein
MQEANECQDAMAEQMRAENELLALDADAAIDSAEASFPPAAAFSLLSAEGVFA